MRSHLLNPTKGNPHLNEAIALGREIYRLYEAAQDYSAHLKQLSLITGCPIDSFAVRSAFGSIAPETFARQLLVTWDRLPTDITEQEMLEMVERIFEANGSELQIQYWISCLRVSTGDDHVSDLIFWPGHYFRDGDNSRCMSPSEVLATALKSGGQRTGA
jgi:hypothetical protein